jgi:hypothetical protein
MSTGEGTTPRDTRIPGPTGSALAWTLVGALVIASPPTIAAFQDRGTPQAALITFVVAISALWVLAAIGYVVMDLLDGPAPDRRSGAADPSPATAPAEAGARPGAPDVDG